MSQRSDAIVVTYEPDIEQLMRLIEIVSKRVGKIFVIDNGSSNRAAWETMLPAESIHFIPLGANRGIATALNAGIEAVRRRSTAQFVALFDQDSSPSVNMVDELETHYDQLLRLGPIAQIGPYFFERNRDCYLPFIEFKAGFPRRKHSPMIGGNWTTADYLITSGALVSLEALKVSGLLDDSLFIDYVDIEWGLRAKAAGYQSYGVFDVRMQHSIGEKALDLPGFRLAMHKPIRRYYYYRNAVLLCWRKYIPLSWKINELARLFLKFWIFALFSRHRKEDVRMMMKGTLDGLRRRSGKLPD